MNPSECEQSAQIHATVLQAYRTWWRAVGSLPADEALQTIYYTLKNPGVKPPFTEDMLTVQRVVLHYYDRHGKGIRTKDVMPPPS